MLEGEGERGFELWNHFIKEERWGRVKGVVEDAFNWMEPEPKKVKEGERERYLRCRWWSNDALFMDFDGAVVVRRSHVKLENKKMLSLEIYGVACYGGLIDLCRDW